MSSSVVPDPPSASRITGVTNSRCRRDAISGTTPPYCACRSACDATTFERMFPTSSTTAAAVSSQLVSRPRITAPTSESGPGPDLVPDLPSGLCDPHEQAPQSLWNLVETLSQRCLLY